MDKAISFGYGIRRQPSIGVEGELSELVNLVPKNGELVNVKPMSIINTTDSEGKQCIEGDLVGVHKVNGGINYITFNEGDNTIKYVRLEKGRDVYAEDIYIAESYSGISIVGNVVIVSCKDGLKYAIWKDGEYKAVVNDLSIKAEVSRLDLRTVTSEVGISKDGLPTGSGGTLYLSYANLNELYLSADAILEQRRLEQSDASEWFKYVTLGMAVLRLYDGSYIACSDIFTLDPMLSNHGLSATLGEDGGSYKLTASSDLSRYVIKLSVEGTSSFDSDLIKGVDIFLSKSTAFPNLSGTQSYKLGDKLFGIMKSDKIIEQIANMQFYKSMSVSVTTTSVVPKVVTGVEEVLDMTAINTYMYNADSLFSYNSRLHLAGIKSTLAPMNTNREQITVPYESEIRKGYYNRPSDAYEPLDAMTIETITPEDGNMARIEDTKVKAVIEVDIDDPNVGFSTNRYYTEAIRYPLPPILSFPSMYATEMRIHIILRGEYCKKTVQMKPSAYGNISFYANVDNEGLSYNQAKDVELKTSDGKIQSVSRHSRSDWSYEFTINGVNESFEAVVENAQPTTISEKRSNILKYSPAGNPFVFPALNTVTVGNEEIQALSTAVSALSPSQFGQFPLYAFCTDGIWALEVGSDGGYVLSKPLPAEVCTNPKSITQIDGAVVFVTDQGLKLIQGSEVVLLSGNMDGHNINERTYFKEGFFEGLNKDYSTFDKLVAQEERDFRKILKDSIIAYDYPNKLLRIFPDGGEKYYIYSFDTREFSSVKSEGMVISVVASTPSSIVQIDSDLYDFSGNIDNSTIREGLLLTRPIDFGEPFAMKKLHDMRLHYTKYSKDTKVRMVVYVSNDKVNWYVLPSLRKGSFKYYRIALVTRMTDDDTLSGMVVRYSLERTNKLR